MNEEKIVTYSPAYTVVPTYECFNRCSYCNFRVDPGKSPWLSLAEAESKLKSLQGSGVCEILVLSGEVHPFSKRRQAWLDLIYNICELALGLGFLPHTNVGLLSFAEMSRLKQVNVSMGLMLEELTPKLLETVHKYAPSKVPELRDKQLKWAGELKIPFTTGLLLGIGESEKDREETLSAIAQLHQSWGNIQEVILQPYSPGTQESWQSFGFNLYKLPELVATARKILPSSIKIQIPPNLVIEPNLLLECLAAGARDLGGISPIDEVNPDYAHIQHKSLAAILSPAGWELVSRLPVYPQYYSWLEDKLQAVVRKNHRKTQLKLNADEFR